MWPLVMYSNYFESFYCDEPDSFSGTYVAMFAFNTVLLYNCLLLYYTRHNMCSAWFFDIRISTCSYCDLSTLANRARLRYVSI